MDFHWMDDSADSQQLGRLADQLEQVARFMSRPDARGHILEKAAECRAEVALIKAAQSVAGNRPPGVGY